MLTFCSVLSILNNECILRLRVVDNVNSRNQDQLDYDEYINDLDGY